MCYHNTAEYSSSRRYVDDDTNQVAVTLGIPCHVFTIIRHPGDGGDPSPGGPGSPSRSSALVFSPASRRAVVWEGRGATARPREAKWSSGVAGVVWVYYNKNVSKDPFGHHYYYCRGALYHKDTNVFSLFARRLKFFTSSATPHPKLLQTGAKDQASNAITGLVLPSSISTDKAELFA